MNKECYLEKINFVKELSDTIVKVQHNIISIHYDVFVNEDDRAEEEYLIIEYNGGAKTARNCFGNSCSAIFVEISKYLNSGYYSEVDHYNTLLENKNLKLFSNN